MLDSFAGGGWGSLVISMLITKTRHLRMVIGSVCLAEFFVVLVSALTFFFLLQHVPSQDVAAIIIGAGHSIQDIALQRKLTVGTLISHLATYIERGNDLDVSPLVVGKKIKEIIDQVGIQKLSAIKEKLPESYTYDEIRLVCAMNSDKKHH